MTHVPSVKIPAEDDKKTVRLHLILSRQFTESQKNWKKLPIIWFLSIKIYHETFCASCLLGLGLNKYKKNTNSWFAFLTWCIILKLIKNVWECWKIGNDTTELVNWDTRLNNYWEEGKQARIYKLLFYNFSDMEKGFVWCII